MAETLYIEENANKETRYKSLIPQIHALTEGEPDLIANVANVVAAIHQTFDFLWVGIYFAKDNELVLGPFQGPIACTRIAFGKGVCGTAWKERKTMVVDDVDDFPGHIACSPDSRSEIVVPIMNREGHVTMVLDIDSRNKGDFDEVDRKYLEEVAMILGEITVD